MTDPNLNAFDVDALLEEAGIADDGRLREAVESLHAAGDLSAPAPTGPLADLLEGRLTAAEAAGLEAGAGPDNVVDFDPSKPRKRRGGTVTGGLAVVALAAAAGLAGVAAADVPPRAASQVVNVTVPPGELENKPERPVIEASKSPEPTPERVVKRDPVPAETATPPPAPAPEPEPEPSPAKKPAGKSEVLNPGKPAVVLPKSVPVKSKTKG